MLLPSVAIIGRPNVGKSRLFNRLVGRTVSIVDPSAGVTRDRILHEVRRDDCHFDLVDTGGIGVVDAARLEDAVHRQIDRAIAAADRIVFLVDVRDGPTAIDRVIADRLRPHSERVILVANKVDHEGLEAGVAEFARLGLGTPLGISAEQGRGIASLFEALARALPKPDCGAQSAAAGEGRLALCLAGRRNVGKSCLANALCGEERMIVAEHPGTTRDAVDMALDLPQGRFLLIDTAGLRRKQQLREDLEFYAACRTERAIRRADVVALVLDATDEVGVVDKKLAHFCIAEGKPTVIVLNKWDLVPGPDRDRATFERYLIDRLAGLAFAPVVFCSALENRRVTDILDQAIRLHTQSQARITTGALNRLLEQAVARRRPKSTGSGPLKLYYMTQAETAPPTFVVFANRSDWVEAGYSRYLENYLRRHLPCAEIPLRFIFKARESRFREINDAQPLRVARAKADRRSNLILPKGSRPPRARKPG